MDSLADLVSFGVAPSILIYTLFELNEPGILGIIGFIILLTFPICGAYRLARFNTAQFDGVFTGVPITIVGCFMALFSFLLTLFKVELNTIHTYITVILMIAGSYLMVSKVHLKKV